MKHMKQPYYYWYLTPNFVTGGYHLTVAGWKSLHSWDRRGHRRKDVFRILFSQGQMTMLDFMIYELQETKYKINNFRNLKSMQYTLGEGIYHGTKL